MTLDATKICIGAAVVSMGDYVAAGGAGSLVDVGHTKGPVTLDCKTTLYTVKSERTAYALDQVPTDQEISFKLQLSQSELENWRRMMNAPAANLTGSGSNKTLLIGSIGSNKYQVQFVVPGVGTTRARTITFWKVVVKTAGTVSFAKSGEQVVELDCEAMYDDSVTTGDKVGKVVDA